MLEAEALGAGGLAVQSWLDVEVEARTDGEAGLYMEAGPYVEARLATGGLEGELQEEARLWTGRLEEGLEEAALCRKPDKRLLTGANYCTM